MFGETRSRIATKGDDVAADQVAASFRYLISRLCTYDSPVESTTLFSCPPLIGLVGAELIPY